MRAGAEMSLVGKRQAAAASSLAAENITSHGLCREPVLAGFVIWRLKGRPVEKQ